MYNIKESSLQTKAETPFLTVILKMSLKVPATSFRLKALPYSQSAISAHLLISY